MKTQSFITNQKLQQYTKTHDFILSNLLKHDGDTIYAHAESLVRIAVKLITLFLP